MTFSHVNRRVHLFLGLFLLPWLFMYGISALPIAHASFFMPRDAAKNSRILRAEHTVDIAVPNDDAGLRVLGAALLDLAAVRRTSFDVYREASNRINVYAYSFWSWTEVNYYVDRRRMMVEDSRFRWDLFLTGMHARGGFQQEGVLPTAWSVVVDLVALAILLWIASGLYMWWDVRGHRRWGWLAIAFGTGSFLVFALRL
jgi:hypothetical protein